MLQDDDERGGKFGVRPQEVRYEGQNLRRQQVARAHENDPEARRTLGDGESAEVSVLRQDGSMLGGRGIE